MTSTIRLWVLLLGFVLLFYLHVDGVFLVEMKTGTLIDTLCAFCMCQYAWLHA